MGLIFSNKKEVVENLNTENIDDLFKTNNLFKTHKAPAAIGPYSKAFFAGDLLFCSGQLGFDEETMELVKGGIENQTKQVCRNISYLLTEHGLSLKNVVKTTIFMKDLKDFDKVNNIYKNYFILKPARSTVEVSRLPKDALIEIEVIAKR